MSDRMRRVNSVMREAVADEVEQLKDPRLGFVTITGVDTAPNLRHATVYYSVLGDEDQKRQTQAALDAAAPRVTHAVGAGSRMKYTPRLHFRIDESVERGTRISKLIHDINEADASRGREEGSPEDGLSGDPVE